MADKDTLNLIKFKFGSFQSIKDLSSKDQSSFYFASNKPTFYNAGLWYGVSSLTSSVNEDTGEVTLVINGGFGDNWESSQVEHTFVAGMTKQQKADLAKAVSFVKTFEDPNIDNTKDVIDKWNEIISFLDGFKDTDVLLDRIVTLETNVTNLQNTTITGGDGLTGGGNLLGNRTIAMGTPSTITDSTINEAKGSTHTHAIDEASTEQRGIVRLNDSLTSESTDQALTARQGKVLNTKVKSITDLVNDMFEKVTDNGKTYIKTKYGFASDEFVSAGGTDDTESGGSGGANLTQMWESLQNNNDTFANIKINKAHIPTLDTSHIPTLTTAKISDFVSATQAIADNAVANKADKATTLAGYGITDAVTLNTNQTISGEKIFSNLKVSNTNLVTNLNADMVDGYDSTTLFTCESGYAIDVNAPHPNKKSGTLLYKISANCSNIPPNCTDGVLVHFNRPKTDTAFQLASNYGNTALYYRSGDLNESSTAYLYNRTWKQLAFTDQFNNYLPLTGGTLTGALTVNAPINNTGALKLLGASDVSSTGMAVGPGAKALGTQSRALASNSYAGIRTGNNTYPYASIEPYDLLPFTVNNETVYGTLIKAQSSLTYSYGGTSYTVQNTTNYTQVLVLITVGSDFVAGVSRPLSACVLTYGKGQSLGRGQKILSINELSDTVRVITLYTWAMKGTGEDVLANAFTISNTNKLYAYKGSTSASGSYSVASGNNSVASGSYSVASGYFSVASGSESVASGSESVASGSESVASGSYSVASGNNSVASGSYSVASGSYSVASGYSSVASGYSSVASGYYSVASHESSKVFATGGISGISHQTVLGYYNAEDANSALVVGWGAGSSARKNIFTISRNGDIGFGAAGRAGILLVSPTSNQIYIDKKNDDGTNYVPLLVDTDKKSVRRGSSGGDTTLGTDQYKWFNVFTEALKIADANLTYDSGTLTIDKALKTTSTLTASQGVFSNYIKIGDATISWDFQNNCLAIDYGLYSTKFISAGGVVTGDASGGTGGVNLMEIWNSLQGNTDNFGTAKIHIDHIPLEAILSNDTYGADVANRINTFAYSGSEYFTSAVKGLITVANIPTLPTSKINGLDTTLEAIYTTLEANTNNISQNASNIATLTSANNDHEERIKALEQALTWQTV